MQISDSHANKVLRDCKIRKCNVLLLPSLGGLSSEMLQFVQELAEGWDSQYEKWLLQEVVGGVQYVDDHGRRYVQTGHSGVDGAYAMIGNWLRDVMPIRNLQMWNEIDVALGGNQ